MHNSQSKRARSQSSEREPPSPQVFVQLYTKDGERSLGSHAATPDTGAEATMIGRRQLLALGLSLADLQPPLHDEVVVANGETLPCLGTYPLQIRLGQRSIVDRAAVFDSVDGILLAWFVVRDFGLIPRNFLEPLPLSVDQVAAPPSSSSLHSPWQIPLTDLGRTSSCSPSSPGPARPSGLHERGRPATHAWPANDHPPDGRCTAFLPECSSSYALQYCRVPKNGG